MLGKLQKLVLKSLFSNFSLKPTIELSDLYRRGKLSTNLKMKMSKLLNKVIEIRLT